MKLTFSTKMKLAFSILLCILFIALIGRKQRENFQNQQNGTNIMLKIPAELRNPQGVVEENLNTLTMMKLTKEWGADIRIVAGHGMKSAVTGRMKVIKKEMDYFDVEFSKHIFKDSELMFDTNSYQVQNIPDELDVLVMSLGVGIQFSCVLKGLKKYNKKVKRIIGVQVGPDRRKLIDSYLNQDPLFEEPFDLEYELYQDTSAYSKTVEYNIGNFQLDDIYEGKAYKWILQNMDLNQKILFWCIGRRLTNGVE